MRLETLTDEIEVTLTLSLDRLPELPAHIGRPTYDRNDLQPGILHIGVGNFHRAHEAVYLDDLFNRGHDLDWGIVGAGLRPNDAAMRERLAHQDWLSTVIEADDDRSVARVTGAMIDYVPVSEGNAHLVDRLSDPQIRIVSMTITEGGYCIDPGTGEFNERHPDVIADAASDLPRGVFGVLVRALERRRKAGLEPFTILSCDNIPKNGSVARDAVIGQARLIEADLAAWIADHTAFPNSMVDRVTPASTPAQRDFVRQEFGIEDAAPVICEPFRQWVMEDNFPTGRPRLEDVGVTYTDQVEAFELMKLRILNASHAMIAYPAALLDITYVHEAMAHPLVRGLMHKVETTEVLPIMPPVPDTDLNEYLNLVEHRFANSRIGDTIERLCQDGSNRQPKFILPSTRDALAHGRPIDGLALVSALWCRYCYGESESGKPIAVDDESGPALTRAARAARQTPQTFLTSTNAFGDLATHPAFQAAFGDALNKLWTSGVSGTLSAFLET